MRPFFNAPTLFLFCFHCVSGCFTAVKCCKCPDFWYTGIVSTQSACIRQKPALWQKTQKGSIHMRYKIAICDDSEKDRAYISSFVKRWAGDTGHCVQIQEFCSAESFLFHYAQEKDFHILLLDIEMGAMDGVTMARRLRRENEEVQIVFITGYSEYIADGYEVDALHYLMKPVKEEKLYSVLDKAAQKLRRNERMMNLELGGEMVRLPICQIRYADVQGNYATIHAKDDYTVRRTLGEIEKELDERFFRIGRSAIVNLHCISRVTKSDIYLHDGSVIALPRGAYEKVNRAIIELE